MVLLVLFFTFSNRVIFFKNSTAKGGISKLPVPQGWEFKGQSVRINQIVNLILKATDRVPARTAAAAHGGIAAKEVQAPRAGTIHGT